jgi:folate-binding protein YgfZ
MPTAYLADRSFVRVSGPDAASWLQNIVTCDLTTLEPEDGRYGALLSPQGKILFDFIASFGRIESDPSEPPAIYLETGREQASEFAKRLAFYRLRAKVEVEDLSTHDVHGKQVGVAVAWGDARAYQGDALRIVDPRNPELGERMLTFADDAVAVATSDPIAFHAHRIWLGIPEGGKDFAYGETFPHEALLDMLGGVDFRKGCYVGQEVVSRMEHRGTSRTRIVPVQLDGDPPALGAAVKANGKAIGQMGSSVDGRGLAMLRLDRAEEALAVGAPLTVGETSLSLSRPGWWHGAFPGESPAKGAAAGS